MTRVHLLRLYQMLALRIKIQQYLTEEICFQQFLLIC